MFENKKRLYIFGSAALSVLVILVVYFSLIASGALNLIQNNLVISSGSSSKIYDGIVLENHTYEINSGKLKSDETIEVIFSESVTDIDVVSNKFIVVIRDDNGNIVTSKYDITYVYGTLEIKALPLTIKSGSATKEYDGSVLVNKEWDFLAGNLFENHTLDVRVDGSIDIVGEVENHFVVIITDENNLDVTNRYDINSIYGKLKITGKSITITTSTATKEYDGLPLFDLGYQFDENQLLNGHNISVKNTAILTTPDSIDNSSDVNVYDEAGNNVSSQYSYNLILGKLTVSKKKITIETFDADKIYDKEPLINHETEHSELISGHSIDIKVIGTTTNVTTFAVKNDFTYVITDEDGNNINKFYEVTEIYGELLVSPCEIVVTSPDKTFIYNGLEQVDTFYEITTPFDGQLEIGKEYPNIDPGYYDNKIDFIIKDEDGEITKNYIINSKLGVVYIAKIDITVKSLPATKDFDGLMLSNDNYVVEGNILDIHKKDYFNNSSITNAGQEANQFTFKILDENDSDITSKFYNVTTDFGLLTVNPKKIQVTTPDLTYTFDTTERVLNELDENTVYTSIKLASGYTITPTFEGTITNYGSVINYCTVVIKDEFNYETNNYEITFDYGNVFVEKQYVKVKTNDDIFEYDGEEHSSKGFELIEGNLYGESISISKDYIKVIEIGCYYNTVGLYVNDEYGNFNLEVTFGNLTVYDESTLPIALSPKSISTGYTGDEIRHSEFYSSSNNLNGFDFWAKQGYSYNAVVDYVIGPAVSAGTYETEIKSITIYKNGVETNDLFDIQLIRSTITINEFSVSLSSADINKTYDGTILVQTEEDINVSLDSRFTYDLELSGGQLTAGVSKMQYTLTIYENGINVTSKFNVVNNLGTLTVNKLNINITIDNYIGFVGEDISTINLNYTMNNNIYTLRVTILDQGYLTDGVVLYPLLKIEIFDGSVDITNNINYVVNDVIITVS